MHSRFSRRWAALNSPDDAGNSRWVAYEHPQVIFQFFDGITGELKYSETVSSLPR